MQTTPPVPPTLQIPEPDVSILSTHIDPDGVYLAATSSKVSSGDDDEDRLALLTVSLVLF